MPQIPRLKFKAILLGVLTDTIGTLVVATGLLFAMAAAGIPADEIVTRMHGLSGLLLMQIVGLGFTLIGAHVAGRSAGQSEVLHGVIVAGAGLVLGLFLDQKTGLHFCKKISTIRPHLVNILRGASVQFAD